MTDLLDIFFKLWCLFLCHLLQRSNLIVCFISILISIVSFFNNICHFFTLFMKLVFQFFVKIIKDNSLFTKTINHQFKIFINSDCLVKLLICFIKPIFKNFYLFLKIVLTLSPRIHSQTIFLFFNNLLLKIRYMDIYVLLSLFLLLNSICNLVKKLLHCFMIGAKFILCCLLVVYFCLSYKKYTISYFKA